ncbi:unnamed protein product [Paramecium sonneborni]|uniref:Uncharacterized protein n=1 Tax=Paramecium sonneborni TaxID=65129 RepID=A0A8S1P5B4_9CILI|nr:unnamed protein product [Paramecium sonneborni]
MYSKIKISPRRLFFGKSISQTPQSHSHTRFKILKLEEDLNSKISNIRNLQSSQFDEDFNICLNLYSSRFIKGYKFLLEFRLKILMEKFKKSEKANVSQTALFLSASSTTRSPTIKKINDAAKSPNSIPKKRNKKKF